MRRTILLADDSPTIQRLVTSTFAGSDYDIVSVSNGEAAVQKIEEIHPHVILADIYMPGKNGYEVCSFVRQHPLLNATPVVLLVGAFDAFDEDMAARIGATANITKPFESQALVSLVESVMPAAAVSQPAAVPAAVAAPTAAVPVDVVSAPAGAMVREDDLLGLESLFEEAAPDSKTASSVTEADIDRIADRVMQRLSSEVIESIAWEIVPDIAEKIVREESKRNP